jgi:hypothetical protein
MSGLRPLDAGQLTGLLTPAVRALLDTAPRQAKLAAGWPHPGAALRCRPAAQKLSCSLAVPGEALGAQAVPDGQVQPPELLADGELARVHSVTVGGQDARAVQAPARGGGSQVPGRRPGAAVLEVVPDPSRARGHHNLPGTHLDRHGEMAPVIRSAIGGGDTLRRYAAGAARRAADA